MSDCNFNCEPKQRLIEDAEFRGEVLARLKALESLLTQIKADTINTQAEIWGAIHSIRSEIKDIARMQSEEISRLYFRVGYISGGIALLMSTLMWLLGRV